MTPEMALQRDVRGATEQLVYRSWWNVDRQGGIGGDAMFCRDAIITMPARTMRGRDEIIKGFEARRARGPRLSRHMVSNLVIDVNNDRRATALYVLLVYAKDGIGPLLAASYQAVCDVEDEVVLDRDEWLIARRSLSTVFLAPDNDSVLLAVTSPDALPSTFTRA